MSQQLVNHKLMEAFILRGQNCDTHTSINQHEVLEGVSHIRAKYPTSRPQTILRSEES